MTKDVKAEESKHVGHRLGSEDGTAHLLLVAFLTQQEFEENVPYLFKGFCRVYGLRVVTGYRVQGSGFRVQG